MKFKLLNESINVPHNAKLCGELTDEELNILAQQIVEDCVEERRDGYYSVNIVTDQRDVDDWDEVECDVHLEGWAIRKGYGDNSELSDFEIDRQKDKDGSYREIPNQVDVYFSVDGCDIYGNDYCTIEYPFTESIYDDMEISQFVEDSKKWISKEIDNFDFDEMDLIYRGYLDFGESLNEELIKPKKDEEKDDFIGRFMSDDLSKKEFPNNKQRFAVCMSIWGKAQKDKE